MSVHREVTRGAVKSMTNSFPRIFRKDELCVYEPDPDGCPPLEYMTGHADGVTFMGCEPSAGSQMSGSGREGAGHTVENVTMYEVKMHSNA